MSEHLVIVSKNGRIITRDDVAEQLALDGYTDFENFGYGSMEDMISAVMLNKHPPFVRAASSRKKP